MAKALAAHAPHSGGSSSDEPPPTQSQHHARGGGVGTRWSRGDGAAVEMAALTASAGATAAGTNDTDEDGDLEHGVEVVGESKQHGDRDAHRAQRWFEAHLTGKKVDKWLIRLGKAIDYARGVHSLVWMVSILVFVRVVGLLRLYTTHDPAGNPIAPDPMPLLVHAIPWNVGVLAFIGLSFALAFKSVEARLGRQLIVWWAGLLFFFLIGLGELDFDLTRFIGTRCTFSVVWTHKAGMFDSAATGPMEDDKPQTVLSILIVVLFGFVPLLVSLVWRRRKNGAPLRWRPVLILAVIAFVCLLKETQLDVSPRSKITEPIELIWARDLLGLDRTPAPSDVNEANDLLRRVQPPRGRYWLDSRYPLVHGTLDDLCAVNATRAECKSRDSAGDGEGEGEGEGEAARPPDVLLYVVESLRGFDVGYANGLAGTDESATPNIDRYARGGVSLPHFISNGFPTREGFFSLHCAALPHRTRINVADHTGVEFDCLPARLRTFGYSAVMVTGSNPSFDNQTPWLKKWYDEFIYRMPEGGGWGMIPDRILADQGIGVIDDHDANTPDKPLFLAMQPEGTHAPFIPHDPELTDPVPDSYEERYVRALRYADEHLARVVDHFTAREDRDTVVVILGDHSYALEGADPQYSELPCDRKVWTSALLYGLHEPFATAFPPGTEIRHPASQIDLAPTLLHVVGDTRPTGTLGRSVLDTSEPMALRKALAVSDHGFRMDLPDVATNGTLTSVRMGTHGGLRWEEDELFPDACERVRDAEREELSEWTSQLHTMAYYYSYLIENGKVWSEQFLATHDGAIPPPSATSAVMLVGILLWCMIAGLWALYVWGAAKLAWKYGRVAWEKHRNERYQHVL